MGGCFFVAYFCLTVAFLPQLVSTQNKTKCGDNEERRTNADCLQVCMNMNERLCDMVGNCFCKAGFVRNEDGKCIADVECPDETKCRYTEKHRNGIDCLQFCKDLSDRYCGEHYGECSCTSWYSREEDGKCYPVVACIEVICPEDEEFQNNEVMCRESCKKCAPQGKCKESCYAECVGCGRGYFRHKSGNCIPAKICLLGDD